MFPDTSFLCDMGVGTYDSKKATRLILQPVTFILKFFYNLSV